jgi:hypothetical protein
LWSGLLQLLGKLASMSFYCRWFFKKAVNFAFFCGWKYGIQYEVWQ